MIEYEIQDDSVFYKDNVSVKFRVGKIYLYYEEEEDFMVSVITKEKATELINKLTECVRNIGDD